MSPRSCRYLLLGLGVAALVTGIHQHRLHSSLRQEYEALARSSTATLPGHRPQSRQRSDVEANAVIERAAASMIPVTRSGHRHLGSMDSKTATELALMIADLDGPGVAGLIGRLREEAELSDEEKDRSIGLCLELLGRENPEQAVALIQSMPEHPEREKRLLAAFGQWLRAQASPAVAWFEQEREKGNPLMESPAFQDQAIQAYSRLDPDRGLAFALSVLPREQSARGMGSGAAMATLLSDTREHEDYMAALRRAAEKSPDDPALASLRTGYLIELARNFAGWDFEDAAHLMDSEFTPVEKADAARQVAASISLEEPGKWADWFADIDLPMDESHPLMEHIGFWSAGDYLAVGKWLDRYPDGMAKEELSGAYLKRLVIGHPEEAARRALAMAPGQKRDELMGLVVMQWKTSAPEQAERFAREHGVAP